jgi:hypothetical protein
VAANIAHALIPANRHAGAVLGAAFWPLALVIALEILTRVEWPDSRRWDVLRWGGLLPVALVAAIVSYRHLSGLLAYWGEDAVTVAIGPLVVDGLMVLASGALLVEPATRRAARRKPATAPAPVAAQPVTPAVERPRTARTRPVVAAPADLHAVGRQVAADLAAQSAPLTRKALVQGLRERGIPVGTDKATQLLAELRAA